MTNKTSNRSGLLTGLFLLLRSVAASPVPASSAFGPVVLIQQSPNLNSNHAMTASSFSTDDNLPAGCTNTSLHGFQWTVSDFHYSSSLTYTTPSHRINGATVRFNLTSNALPELNVYCDAYSSDFSDPFYGQRVYDCTTVVNSTSGASDGSEGGEWGGVSAGAGQIQTQFRYWKSSQSVEVRQTWACDDLEGPGNMAIFSANGTSAAQTPNCTFEEHQTPPAEWKNGDTYYWNVQACTLSEFSFAPSELQVFA
ncbi:hypothetical protein NEUTE1DRAFT_53237 [Neurospora tetrasperma FGSC 2508]|uniref:AA1-like domain-containing protein n=1 Tax=Neurospora tetrasperma (strain FGSC 2508 / ATCC MYA-4615 / P0657) TaxID=510951 RepID=F8MZA5_NEUT8|nr:uncharacterized protein NEUTE1DRAFT_53237 [Neurospora tetrasperma FGSC 2508]EGO51996.1 hypothetical protein NEUTE1DRAFT_53237 [Neurospora tetrasperma FGSC 2508]